MEGEKKALQGKTTESISVLRRTASDKQSSKQRAHDETLPSDCVWRPPVIGQLFTTQEVTLGSSLSSLSLEAAQVSLNAEESRKIHAYRYKYLTYLIDISGLSAGQP